MPSVRVVALAVCVLAAGCRASEPGPVATRLATAAAATTMAPPTAEIPPPVPVTETVVPSEPPAAETATIAATPTLNPTREPPTEVAASATAKPVAAEEAEDRVPPRALPALDPEWGRPLPEPAALRWEEVPQELGRLRVLRGIQTEVGEARASPDGRHWAIELASAVLPGGPTLTALYVLDAEGNDHWVAATSGNSQLHEYAWLPDGRLLWADLGGLYLADGAGTGYRDLQAPEVIQEVWVGTDAVALASGDSGLWRVGLDTGSWEQVPGLTGNAPVSQPGANLTIAPDGSYAALIRQGELWRVPLAAGAPAEYLTTVLYPGRGGRINPPSPLAGSPYWALGEPVILPNLPGAAFAFLDTRDGRVAPLPELEPSVLAPDGAPFVSPDGRWVAIVAGGAESGSGGSLYVAPSAEVGRGQLMAGTHLLGWSSDPDAAYIVAPPDLVRVALPSGATTTLLQGL
ncbi:MAG TPA: hypothetical protein VER55_10090, partial [Ardenticatenaceae bacterium]|nr:hypothetical protein [Ardenticatenaceae bacterium]